MIQYRPFRNTDPPKLVEIWRDQARFPALVSTLSTVNLEDEIFAKPYFDSEGLIIAESAGKPLGFVHAAFAFTPDGSDLDCNHGVVVQLRVVPGDHESEVIEGLMKAALQYLANKGAKTASFGSDFPSSPFYLGLYGGSRVPGIVEHDAIAQVACERFGFEFADEIAIFRRNMIGFRTVVDRQQMKVRRSFQIRADADPSLKSWEEACTMGRNMRMRFSLIDRKDESIRGSVSYWDMEPMAKSLGMVAMGMYNLTVDDEARRAGLATFLVGESLRHLAGQTIGMIEAQTKAENEATCGLLLKLGFERHASGRQAVLKLA